MEYNFIYNTVITLHTDSETQMVGKKVARETLLPSVHEDDGDEGHEEETLGGIRSRPPSRPRNIYSRGSVDSQVSAASK